MDNTWQVKCGSTLQSTTPCYALSTPQQSPHQVEINSGQLLYPHDGVDLRPQVHGRMTDNTFYSAGHADLGNSFLALLSGPPSLLQCDFQDFSNPTLFSSTSKPPVEGSNGSMAAAGTEGRSLFKSNGFLSENVSYQNLRNGAAAGSCSVLQYGLQDSDLAKATIHQMGSGNEKIKDFPSARGEWSSVNTDNAAKLQNANSQSRQKMPLEGESSVSNHPFSFVYGCPRVVCSSTCGDLLLSNTGLIGILCFCHRFHMSVSKFCEHSGLWNVNPGNAVRMESGETIAQWRKLYFQKLGIRVPEDQSGWNWPEGLSLTPSLVKSGVSMPMSKNSDCRNLLGSSGGVVRSRQPIDNKNCFAEQNLVIEAVHNKLKRNVEDGNKFLGLVGTLQSNLHGVRGSQVMDCPMSRHLTVPSVVGRGPENGYQSMSAYVDSIAKTGSLPTTNLSLQSSRALLTNSDVCRANGEKKVVFVDKDVTSSSIELRLGQPNQQSQSSRNQALSTVGPRLHNTLVDSQKPFSEEHMIHYVTNCREERQSREHHFLAAGLSNYDTREHHQLNHGYCPISNVRHVAKQDKLKIDMAGTSVASLFEPFNAPPEASLYSKATNNVMNISEHITPEMLHHESHTAKCNPLNVQWNGESGLEREWTANQLGFFRPIDKGKAMRCLTANSQTETVSGSKMQKWMEHTSSVTGMAGGNSYSDFSAVHDKSCCSHHLSSMLPGASNAGNFSSYREKLNCLGSGHMDLAFVRSMGSPMGSAKILPSQAVPLGVNASTSASISGLSPAFLQQGGIGISPCLLDDNLRLLALRQILEPSKQQKALFSLGENQEHGRCNDNLHHSLVDSSTSGQLGHGPNLTSRKYVSEIPMKLIHSGPSDKIENDEFTPVTGLNNWCSLSTLAKGITLQCRDFDMQCQFFHDPPQSEQKSLRLGRTETSMTHSNVHEHESCCQGTPYVQGNCICATHKKFIGGKCTFREVNPPNSFREQMGDISGKTPISITPHCVKNCIVAEETNVSLGQCGKLMRQLPKNTSYHTSQWKDVPSKTKEVCEVACIKQSAGISGRRGHEVGRFEDTTVKCYNVFSGTGVVHSEDSFKEEEVSNISSGCSTPAITQESVEVNNMDSSTVVAANTGYVNDLIVDEGSGIDKCWSSDDALESDRSPDFPGSACMKPLRKDISFKVTRNQSSHSLLDEVKLMDSLTWKRGRNQIHSGIKVFEKSNHSQESEMGLNTGKRKRETKLKVLDASLGNGVPVVGDKRPECDGTAEWPRFSKDMQIISLGKETSCSSGAPSFKPGSKCGKSTISLAKALSRKRALHGENCKVELINSANFYKIVETSGRKKSRSSGATDDCAQVQTQEPIQSVDEKTEGDNLVSCINAHSSLHVNVCNSRLRPVVCGKYGEISNGETIGDVPMPVKIVSLDKILKTASRCTLPRSCKARQTLQKQLKRTIFSYRNACSDRFSNLKKENESHDASGYAGMSLHNILKGKSVSTSRDKQSANEFLLSEKKRGDKHMKASSAVDTKIHVQSKAKFKEIRRRSLYELTSKGKNSSTEMGSHSKILNRAPKTKVRKLSKNPEDCKVHIHGSHKVTTKRYVQEQSHLSIMDLFCCVCGSSNQDEVNCLLECRQCLIRVHQACYGVSKVPKGPWRCRPCRTNSKNIVCVLCGYGGGAMTRALRCCTIMKTLLTAWSFETECSKKNAYLSAETLQDELSISHTSGSVIENSSFPLLRPVNIEPSSSAVWSMDMQNQLHTSQGSLGCVSSLRVNNSITAGILDSTVKQWVHVVCGLWTPGTRCANVDTMSAFDVSGASHSIANMVCYMCNRPGGSCIQCRVVNCSIQFHPWCAHQKGLLQSEVEGADNENVGFYGRCLFHATSAANETAFDADDVNTGCLGEKSISCARTEGYKGCKRDGFWHNLHGQPKGKGVCLVPPEQLNAWVHINGQNSCAWGLSKLPMSDVEYDCRKEYARYKQAKGWKHLVVYNSGIHALGLYTSRFMTRGEMVVEYVGEIVGLRVADKREIEYQCGRKLQCKSACYFFRIDKEHIIDATRKGGIARFVNHSCLPNCVAKVISVRNEKKVVFFAERDIYPGEEITYDYHFNHEDEGKKIPCFCNSNNCRRYLN